MHEQHGRAVGRSGREGVDRQARGGDAPGRDAGEGWDCGHGGWYIQVPVPFYSTSLLPCISMAGKVVGVLWVSHVSARNTDRLARLTLRGGS